MRPSSVGGAAYCVALCLSVCPSVSLSDVVFLFYSRTVLRANIQNRKTSVFAYGPASRMYFSARTEGRISYGHLGRTNSCYTVYRIPSAFPERKPYATARVRDKVTTLLGNHRQSTEWYRFQAIVCKIPTNTHKHTPPVTFQ